jgi:hypothetical protein
MGPWIALLPQLSAQMCQACRGEVWGQHPGISAKVTGRYMRVSPGKRRSSGHQDEPGADARVRLRGRRHSRQVFPSLPVPNSPERGLQRLLRALVGNPEPVEGSRSLSGSPRSLGFARDDEQQKIRQPLQSGPGRCKRQSAPAPSRHGGHFCQIHRRSITQGPGSLGTLGMTNEGAFGNRCDSAPVGPVRISRRRRRPVPAPGAGTRR